MSFDFSRLIKIHNADMSGIRWYTPIEKGRNIPFRTLVAVSWFDNDIELYMLPRNRLPFT